MVRVDSSATFSSSSLVTSSPVSASTLAYLMRWPVFRLSWLNETFSDSDVAGYSATGQVTSERRRKPFQFARGAMYALLRMRRFGLKTNGGPWFRHPPPPPSEVFSGFRLSTDSTFVHVLF